jgi:pimeloyl-ACP methyl ester carboxylesterase
VAGLAANRHDLCRLIWKMWSPNWKFDEATYEATGAAFDNPDFVDIVIHSYRHRYQAAPSDPAYEEIERRLALRPKIAAPTIVLQGEAPGTVPPEASVAHAKHFTGPYQRRTLPRVGHNVPQEAPRETADAVRELAGA